MRVLCERRMKKMVFQAGRWQQLSMTERWLLLNGIAALQKQRRERRRQTVSVTSVLVHTRVNRHRIP